MKKTLIFLSFGLLFFIVVAVMFPRGNKNLPKEAGTTDTSPALVSALSSDVSLKEPAQADFEIVEKEAHAPFGSTVKTSREGRALIEFSSSARAVLDFDSELVIEERKSDSQQTRLSLLSGQIWSRVEKTLERGEFYEIKTQNGVAVVRGTSFSVTFRDGRTEVAVATGTVALFVRDYITGEPIFDTETLITEGKSGVLEEGGEILVEPIPSEVKGSEWYTFNEERGLIPLDLISPAPPHKKPIEKKPADIKPFVSPAPAPVRNIPRPPADLLPPPPKIESAPLLELSKVTPPSLSIVSGELGTVTLSGKGFLKTNSVFLGKQNVRNFKIADDTKILLSVPAIEGTFDVSVSDINAHVVTLPQALTVIVTKSEPVAPTSASQVDPPSSQIEKTPSPPPPAPTGILLQQAPSDTSASKP